MSSSRPLRHLLPRLAALVAFLAAAGVVASAPQVPEKEDPKGGVKKKVAVEDDPEPAKGPRGPAAPPDVRLDELAVAAQTGNPALKDLFNRLSVPHDLLTTAKGSVRIKPVPLVWGKDPFPKDGFGVAELDAQGRPGEYTRVLNSEVRRLEPYEQVVAAAVDQLLKQKPAAVTSEEQLAAAEKLVAAGLRFHDFAKDKNVRQGKSWAAVRTPLADLQKTVWMQQLHLATGASDWPRVGEVSSRLLAAYASDPAVAKEVSAARIAGVERLLQSKSHADHVRARELLDELERRLPGGGGEPAKKARALLTREAQRLFEYAKDKKGVGDLAAARDAMRNAEALDPTIPGLRDLQRDLKVGYPILVVGARVFPEQMSPATARFDSEKQAVALMFEGLLEEVPDDAGGVRYRPGAARFLPSISPGGRDLLLRLGGGDGSGRTALDAHDMVGTVRLLRSRPELWASAPLAWFPDNDLPTPIDGGVRVPFKMSHPDPRALLTFRILPARWMAESGKAVDDPEFAARPQGTGPYRLLSTPPAGAAGREARQAVFVDNQDYGKWPDRTGLPHIREVRMVEVGLLSNLVDEFKYDRIHILPDVPTAELERFLGPNSGLLGKVTMVTAANNRRVHILAVNHRRPHLQNKDLRRGLSLAIDRETVLSDVFRAGRTEFHRPMTGPFPPTSWATTKGPDGKGAPLVNRDLAVRKFQAYLAAPGAKPEVTLAFPEGDPPAAAACARIKAQVEALFKDADPKARLTLLLEAVPPRELVRRVEIEHRYELAYVPFDYPDDWHPFGLAAFLDPAAAGREGRNCLGYLTPETNPDADDLRLGQMLRELRGYRDFAGALVPKVREAHQLFNDCVPFVPLWQLDRHMLVHTSLKVFVEGSADPVNARVLNPTVLFQGVARWRLD